MKFTELTKPSPHPVGSNVRKLEIRITDLSTKSAYFYVVDSTHGEMESEPAKVKFKLLEGCGKLLDAIFKPRPPQVNTVVVDDDEKKDAKG